MGTVRKSLVIYHLTFVIYHFSLEAEGLQMTNEKFQMIYDQ
jgi:hypothetical protein